MEKMKKGDFCWTELGSPNLSASKKFYHEIFQWDFTDHSTAHGNYMMFRVGENDVGGAYEVTKEMKSQGVPNVWGSYVLVDDVVKVAEKAKQLGANVVREPMEVMEAGKMAVFVDPTGAVISVWQTNGEPGKLADVNKQGAPSWFELRTTDPKKAGDFYTKLFGWTVEKSEVGSGSMEYFTFKNDGRPAAGMFEIKEEMGKIPPHWGIYFTVNNLEKTLEKATKMGANLLYDIINIPEIGRFTGLQDPEGIAFSVIQYNRV